MQSKIKVFQYRIDKHVEENNLMKTYDLTDNRLGIFKESMYLNHSMPLPFLANTLIPRNSQKNTGYFNNTCV